ncbi:MAG: hypothetical protein QOI20_2863 [Acidimicrobiaceae bacterium]|nr:hypothetical protein [Acidimicrobiaceae bacterium]
MRRMFLALAAVLAIVVATASPGGAATVGGGGVLVGAGTVTSGAGGLPIPPPGVPADATFSGTLVGTVDLAVGTFSCNLNFVNVPVRIGAIVLQESVSFGSGTWTGGCAAPVSGCTGTYARVASELVMAGACTVNGHSGTWTAELLWVPTSVNPTTSFSLAGAVAVVVAST